MRVVLSLKWSAQQETKFLGGWSGVSRGKDRRERWKLPCRVEIHAADKEEDEWRGNRSKEVPGERGEENRIQFSLSIRGRPSPCIDFSFTPVCLFAGSFLSTAASVLETYWSFNLSHASANFRSLNIAERSGRERLVTSSVLQAHKLPRGANCLSCPSFIYLSRHRTAT